MEEPIDAENADNDKQTGNLNLTSLLRYFLRTNTNATLEQDEAEVINESNTVRGRTRGAKPRDTYKERSENSMGLGG